MNKKYTKWIYVVIALFTILSPSLCWGQENAVQGHLEFWEIKYLFLRFVYYYGIVTSFIFWVFGIKKFIFPKISSSYFKSENLTFSKTNKVEITSWGYRPKNIESPLKQVGGNNYFSYSADSSSRNTTLLKLRAYYAILALALCGAIFLPEKVRAFDTREAIATNNTRTIHSVDYSTIQGQKQDDDSLYGCIALLRIVPYSLGIRFYVNCEAAINNVDQNTVVWVVNHESNFDPKAYNKKTHDRGLFQINKKYHPEVSDACAYNVVCATEWSLGRIKNGFLYEWVSAKPLLTLN